MSKLEKGDKVQLLEDKGPGFLVGTIHTVSDVGGMGAWIKNTAGQEAYCKYTYENRTWKKVQTIEQRVSGAGPLKVGDKIRRLNYNDGPEIAPVVKILEGYFYWEVEDNGIRYGRDESLSAEGAHWERVGTGLDNLSTMVHTEEVPCHHTWTSYTGLTEVYDYCTKCDKKREKVS